MALTETEECKHEGEIRPVGALAIANKFRSAIPSAYMAKSPNKEFYFHHLFLLPPLTFQRRS